MKKLLLAFVAFVLVSGAFAQKYTVSGVAKDGVTKEPLIGATIIYAPGKGTVTDIDGNYTLKLDAGTYKLICSYVGFQSQEKEVQVNKNLSVNFELSSVTLNEVKIIADVAIDRSTPVAYANVDPKKISEELASQDMPMILNSTPGVYATQSGGGDGDARISIRGFNQRNVGVMIDGIPVNDMENGWVYWSNWFGLDMVTRTMQVQRGLGASKVALPSVGGAINILTAGIENKASYKIKQEIGSFGFQRTSFGVNSGKLKNGWGVAVAGSFKQSNGWVQQTPSKGYFYYGKLEKTIGKHRLSLSAFGAPQRHGQRSFKNNIAVFDEGKANELGVDTAGQAFYSTADAQNYPISARGYNYNQHWGELERYEITAQGDTIRANKEILNSRVNFFHKPQISLRDYWNVSPRLYISTVAYLSVGKGGGTSLSDEDYLDGDGQIAFQELYDKNSGYRKTPGFGLDPSIDTKYSPSLHKSGEILRVSNNDHFWYGGLSTFNFEYDEFITFSGGLDLRSYKGSHYRTVYDLLGGDYFIEDNANPNETNRMKMLGDTIDYNYDSKVRWGGLFGQAEYKKDKLSAFVNITGSLSAYQRIDYYKLHDVVIDGETYEQKIGSGDVFYYNGSQYIVAGNGATVFTKGDTTFVSNTNQSDTTYIVGATPYTITSDEARVSQTDWEKLPSYTFKAGANYNIDDHHNVFMNVGYLNRAARFDNVFDRTNKRFVSINNEKIKALELGYGYRSKKFSANVNTYYTVWKDKPYDGSFRINIDGENFSANVPGMDAIHKGVEVDFAYRATKQLTLEGLISLGDWRWNSAANFALTDNNGNQVTDDDGVVYVDFNAKGVKVGDAAQTQLGGKVKYNFDNGFYLSTRGTFFGSNYSNFDPFSLSTDNPESFDDEGNPRQAWRMPNYFMLDVHGGYKLSVGKSTVKLSASMLNALNALYIIDAQNNDSFTGFGTSFDASSAAVFFGPRRRFNISLQLSF